MFMILHVFMSSVYNYVHPAWNFWWKSCKPNEEKFSASTVRCLKSRAAGFIKDKLFKLHERTAEHKVNAIWIYVYNMDESAITF